MCSIPLAKLSKFISMYFATPDGKRYLFGKAKARKEPEKKIQKKIQKILDKGLHSENSDLSLRYKLRRNEVIKIGYLSFDASVKIHYSGTYTSTKTSTTGHGCIAGYIRHIDRGTDKMNGCEVQHSNPDIDSDLTLENESYYKDSNGEWQKTSHSKDMVDAINRRIEYAKEHGARITAKGKNDTVIVRPLVVQLDKETISEHKNWTFDIIEILEKEFGADNITGFSVHNDETHPHLHISFIPCHKSQKNGEIKCTISQTKFFKNPKQLAALHRKIRKSLLDKGYDIEQENKPIEEHLAGRYDKNGEWHQQGLTPDQLKELSDRKINLKLEEIKMSIRRDELDRLEMAVADMMKSSKAEKEELEKERISVENDRATVQAQSQAVAIKEMEVQKRETEVTEILEICNQIVSDEKNLNAKFLEFLDRESKRTGKRIRENVENLYKRFQNERKKNVSEWQLELLRLRNERLKHGDTTTDNYLDIIDITDIGYDDLSA